MQPKTLREIYDQWKGVKSRLVKPSSLATYVINAEKHVLPVFGDRVTFTAADVQAFAFSLLGSGLSVKTVRDVLIVLRMITAYGSCMGWTGWTGGRIALPAGREAARPQIFTVAQQRSLMAALSSLPTPRNVGLYLCLCTGLRIGEVCALRWSDVDLQAGVVSVSRTIGRIYVSEGGRRATKIVIGTPKTATSRREIPLGPVAAALLAAVRPQSAADSYLLTGTPRPLEPRLYRSYYVRLVRRLGLPAVKFHGLRHTFATRCIESGCDCKTVSSLLGHASVSTTLNLYVHPGIGQKRACVDRMMQALEG